MLDFDKRTGPVFEPAPAYPEPGVPGWFSDAKLGFFIHWGLYSVPAWATAHGEGGVPTEDAYTHHQYAEWYGNTVRIPGSPTWERHQEVYGSGTSYEDLADLWDTTGFDSDELIGQIADAGAQYVIPTTKHHEGFCLWGTDTTPFNAVRRGPRRDLIQELHDSTRARGLKFGTYFSGALDWHVSDFPPIESDTDLFRFRRNDERFARYSAAQLEELIDRFRPDVLWNDIEWPDSGKGTADYSVASLFKRYLAVVPEGVVNDRWGVPYHGFVTREYRDITETLDYPWESTRGLGFSFGYNQAETPDQSLSGTALIRLLVDVVSKNGNLLVNVGPRADGSIPDLQADAMRELGAFLRLNGDAVFGSRPWHRFGEGGRAPVRYTTKGRTVFVHLLDPSEGEFPLPRELSGRSVRWLAAPGSTGAVPEALRGDAVAVAVVE